jgi:hypothetical protein
MMVPTELFEAMFEEPSRGSIAMVYPSPQSSTEGRSSLA